MVTQAAETVAASARQKVGVEDLRPLPAGNPGGDAQLFLFLALALPSIAFGAGFAGTLGTKLPAPARLGALAAYALLAGFASVVVVDGVVGALVGAPFALFGLAVLCAFAIATASSGVARVLGLPFAPLLALLIVVVGEPAAGGPYGAAFVSPWYADLGRALPPGAMLPAVRDIVYFGGNAVGGPLLVLSLWAAAAAAVNFLPSLRRRPATRNAAAAPRRDRAASDGLTADEAPRALVPLATHQAGIPTP